jgi:hypothetical protein
VNLEFRRGDANQPRGHALAFFEASDGRILGTYLVIAPITIDLAKYMPPMFAGQMPSRAAQEASAMPLPPIPEEIAGGVAELERLAQLRGDDLIACGSVDATQIDRMLMAAAEAGQRYVQLYRAWLDRAPASVEPPSEAPALDVDEVMLSLMGEHDRVAEVAKLVGKLRYSIEVQDKGLTRDTVAEMERVGRYLGEKYRVPDLIEAAQRPDATGAKLAQLHVERCYKLAAEEYMALGAIEAEIKRLDEEPAS